MAAMKGWSVFLPLLAGCGIFSSGPSSKTGDTPEHLRMVQIKVPVTYDVYPYGDASAVHPGQWARFRVTERGSAYEITLAAGAREGEGTWMEVIEEDEVRRVSARLVSADGTVLKAFYREMPRNGAASPVLPQEITQRADPQRPRMMERSRVVEKRDYQAGGRTIPTSSVKIEYEDINGRVRAEEWGWSKEVPPLFDGSEDGGLVRKRIETQTVELLEVGDGHKPLVEIPR